MLQVCYISDMTFISDTWLFTTQIGIRLVDT